MSTQRAAALQALGDRVRPLSPAESRMLPVSGAFGQLLPGGGLARGSATEVRGAAATSLALALAAGASGAGSWVAVVGLGGLGVLAAEELGIDLERLILVAEPPPGQWTTVVATLAEAFDVVLAQPLQRIRPTDARRLQARARERGSALVLRAGSGPGAQGVWPEAADLTITGSDPEWQGLGRGHGHLRARQLTVEVVGRRAAARANRVPLWLPGPDGRVDLVVADPAVLDRTVLDRTVLDPVVPVRAVG